MKINARKKLKLPFSLFPVICKLTKCTEKDSKYLNVKTVVEFILFKSFIDIDHWSVMWLVI